MFKGVKLVKDIRSTKGYRENLQLNESGHKLPSTLLILGRLWMAASNSPLKNAELLVQPSNALRRNLM
jgi:hypothetical protein